MDLVSVVVPVYNVEQFIGRCIESVFEQTYRTLEIILVDDGSTDKSGEICDSYAQKDSRVRVLHQQNQGLSAARNSGIKISQGNYIVFVDSDDFVAKDFIEILYNEIVAKDADVAVCGFEKGESNFFVRRKKVDKYTVEVRTSQAMMAGWHGKYKQIETMAWNKLYKKDLFISNKLLYPEGCYFEDVYLTHLLISVAKKIVIVHLPLYYYYQRRGSIVSTISAKKIEDSLMGQQQRRMFFKENKLQGAYERLSIKELKYCVLNYFRYHNKLEKESLRRIRKEFCEIYLESQKYTECSRGEKIIFGIIYRLFSLENIFNIH